MFKKRLPYLFVILAVVALGLLSRKLPVPLWIGDVLWALMVYFMVRMLYIKAPFNKVVIISLLFCFGIEFSQLYQVTWINELRQTMPGRLILGQGFLWGDLLAYTIGVMIGVVVDRPKPKW